MTTYSENTIFYSFEKGKLGSSSGLIYPFFTKLNSVVPDQQYRELIPAGFLKCQGQVLDADSYRSLANVIGVGDTCIYKRPDVLLTNDDENGEGGQIQLPDLGSKYILAAAVSGNYANFDTSDEKIIRAGVQTDIRTIGDQVEFFYTGSFRVPGRDLQVQGNIISDSPPARTDQTNLSMGNFLPHGHMSDFTVADRVNTNSRAHPREGSEWRDRDIIGIFCQRSGGLCDTTNVEYGATFVNITAEESGSETAGRHSHFGTFPRIVSENATASLPSERVSSGPLFTTVNVRSTEQLKMDLISPKFILCEYLIKY